jgi:hypothetical protein
MQKPAKTESVGPYKAEATDLRAISRDSARLVTHVRLYVDWDNRNAIEWLTLGASSVRYNSSTHKHSLEARLGGGATDFEHDSAYAIRLPLIGLKFDDLLVYNHQTRLVGWVDPEDEENFRVPRPGYDPTKLPDAFTCKECKGKDKHVIVPEGYYVPPRDRDLYRAVRGKRVDIVIGYVDEEEPK